MTRGQVDIQILKQFSLNRELNFGFSRWILNIYIAYLAIGIFNAILNFYRFFKHEKKILHYRCPLSDDPVELTTLDLLKFVLHLRHTCLVVLEWFKT